MLTAAGFIAFLKRLLHDAEHNGSNPVFCIVDNHPAHRAKAVDRFVGSTDGALRLYRLFDLEGERRHDLVRIAAWG
jgi:hypothetical protein